MTRVTRYKVGYVLVLVIGVGAGILFRALGGSISAFVFVGIILLLPGRVQGFYFREFFRGRHLLTIGRPADALMHFTQFLTILRSEPWRKKLLWLSWSVYTPDIEAMTLNNIGASHMAEGRFDEAIVAFHEALAIDPQYPLPYCNIAAVLMMQGDKDSADRLIDQARKLGYTAGKIDAVIHRAQAFLASVEGRGLR